MDINRKLKNGFQFTIFHDFTNKFKRQIDKFTLEELIELEESINQVFVTIAMKANIAYLKKKIGNLKEAIEFSKEFLNSYKFINKDNQGVGLLSSVEVCCEIVDDFTELKVFLKTLPLTDKVCKKYLEKELFFELIAHMNDVTLDDNQLQYKCIAMIELGYGYSAIEEYKNNLKLDKFSSTYTYLLDKLGLIDEAIEYINSYDDPEDITELINMNRWLYKLGELDRFKKQFNNIIIYYEKTNENYIKGYIDKFTDLI